jgi:hypothetical protein
VNDPLAYGIGNVSEGAHEVAIDPPSGDLESI